MYLFKNATRKEIAGFIAWALLLLFIFIIPFVHGLLEPKDSEVIATVTNDLIKCQLSIRSSQLNMLGNSRTETQNDYGEFRILCRYGCTIDNEDEQYVYIDIPREISETNNLIKVKTPIKLFVWVNDDSGYSLSDGGRDSTSIWCEPMKEYEFKLIKTAK